MSQTETSAKPSQPLSRRTKLLLAGLLLIAILLTLLPIAIKHLAVHLAKQQGISQIEIKDIDLNLFSGTFGLYGVRLSGNGQGHASLARLYLNISMLGLLSKRLELEQLELTGLELDLQSTLTGDWIVAGILPPPASPTPSQASEAQAASEPWGIGIQQASLGTISAHLNMPKLKTDLHIDSLQLSQLASWLPQQTSPYQAQLRITQAPLQLSGTMQPFTPTPQVSGNLNLQQLPLSLVAAFARDAGIKELDGELRLDSKFTAKIDSGQPILESQTDITLSKLTLKMKLAQQQYQLANQHLNWNGQLNYVPAENDRDLGLRVNGGLTLKQFSLQDTQARLTLALFEQLQLNQIELAAAQQLSVNKIELAQLTLLQKQQDEILTLANTTVNTLGFDGKQTLTIDSVNLDALSAKIKIKTDGKILLLDQLQNSSSTPPASPAATSKESTSEPFKIKLAQLNIADNSQIIFDDESVSPAYHAEIKQLNLSLANIDSTAARQQALLKLKAVINKHSKLNIDAQIMPFGPSLNMSAKGDISALELPPASPYANKAMGYYLKRGQLNASIDLTVKDDQLDANIHALLKKFNIEEGNPDKAKEFSDSLSMPLDAALNLLRDKHDDIKLDIKIDGDINDPQLDISKVINKALGNATKMAVTSYLKFMLQPWGTLLTIVEMVGEPGSVNLDPVVFAGAETQLSNEQQQYLNKIAALLQERPNIELNICGLASETDRQALMSAQQPEDVSKQQDQAATDAVRISNEQLLELANQRGQLIKEQLISAGVDAGRLFSCHPNMEGAETNPAQVLLNI